MAIEYSGGTQAAPASGQSLTIDPAMLPEGIAATLKDGDVIRMRVVGSPDASGALTVVYDEGGESAGPPAEVETMQEGEEANYATGEVAEEGESWEDEFRRSMSPQNEQTEAS